MLASPAHLHRGDTLSDHAEEGAVVVKFLGGGGELSVRYAVPAAPSTALGLSL